MNLDSFIPLGLHFFICEGGSTGFLRIKGHIVGASSIFSCYLSLLLSGADRVQAENVARNRVRVLCLLSKEMGKFLSLVGRKNSVGFLITSEFGNPRSC